LSIAKINKLGAHPAIALGSIAQFIDLFDEFQRRCVQSCFSSRSAMRPMNGTRP
jgi:hypothetical protein